MPVSAVSGLLAALLGFTVLSGCSGTAPPVTEYTANDRGYFDEPGFRPTVTFFPVPEGTAVQGAVLHSVCCWARTR